MKRILITGATSGIGKALALHAAKNNYNVIACGRNQDALDALAQQANITSLRFDVTNEQDALKALKDIHVDYAVLNAGTCEYVDVDAFEPKMFRRVFEPNFFGVVNCVNGLLPNLRPGNKLIIVDSMSRLLPFTRTQAYGASKAALHYFTKSLDVDLHDKGIHVQAVSPGFVETPLTDKNEFEMPMKITAEEAASAMLKGIESSKGTVYFPRMFGLLLRFMHKLPESLKKKLSLSMREK
ncbi:SDR family NAD(P)-dependent oxidoreductase [Alteromonas sp. 345S023]|uniref:SDR family NAD(P)-dependent oxidoreductase n=1 Tax=Alteromonas profundi TaxID=2696062 RepID=A0A7X5RLJ7_9ALTE|nr:SDR family NAD(P)-dependent oxidoreductase [Alteromonas profundi]NDV92133.1 SDR family NAD(P)-dependent oxidoreductase [Alteromonas profundi]